MKLLKGLSIAGYVAAVVLAGGLAVSQAQADDKGEIGYRKAVMSAIGGHMKGLVGIVKGETANKGDMRAHADGMLAMAKIATHIFPEGSDAFAAPTGALDKIWEKPEEFAKVRKAFVAEAEKVATAAKSGDRKVLAAAVSSLGKNACKACHDNFRKKEQ